jgi:NAD(P)-dependent dehydrogenase (short-subunit alcohol dehydrogenase family)
MHKYDDKRDIYHFLIMKQAAVIKRRKQLMISRDSVAFVTGANRGIGAALVQALANAGIAKIYAGTRSLSSFNGKALPETVIPVELDVIRPDQVDRLAKAAPDVTLLFNNAGVLTFGDILSTTWEEVETSLRVNYLGKLRVARAFVPVIEQNGGGAIVQTLTLVALASMPGLSVYNASKAAAWSMTQSLRASLSDRRISVHGVFPGAVDTAMLAGVEIDKANPDDVARSILEGVIEGKEDIFPEAMSSSVYEAWTRDHKAVEKQFAAM